MANIIIPPILQSRYPRTDIGEQLGSGIAGGLQALLESKTQQLAQKQKQEGLQSMLPNASPEVIRALAADPNLAREYVKQELRRPGEESFARLMGGFGEQPSQQQGQEQPQEFGGIPPAMEGLEGFPSLEPSQAQAQAQGEAPRLTQSQATELAKMQQKERARADKAAAEEIKGSKKEQAAKNKTLSPILNKSQESLLKQKQHIQITNNLDKLNKEGVGDAAWNTFVSKSGLDWMLGANAQEFQSQIKFLMDDMKEIFGGRILGSEFEQFLKSLPGLNNTPEGRERIIKNLKNVYKAKLLRDQVTIDTIKKYKNRKDMDALDVQLKITDRVNKATDALAKKINDDLRTVTNPEDLKPYVNIDDVDGTQFIRVQGKEIPYEDYLRSQQGQG